MASPLLDKRILIRTGKLAPAAGEPEQAAPGSGATITIYDQTADHNGVGNQKPACPFDRITFTLMSSHDSGASGVVFSESEDGTNFDTVSSQTYTASNGLTTFDFLCRGGHPKIAYTNSANVLTSWRYTLTGILGDRNPGVP